MDWCVSVLWGISFYLKIKKIWPCHETFGILIPQPGIEPVSPALEAWSLSPWTFWEVLGSQFFWVLRRRHGSGQLADLPELRWGLIPRGVGNMGVASWIFLAPLLAWSSWVPPHLSQHSCLRDQPSWFQSLLPGWCMVRADLPAVWGLLLSGTPQVPWLPPPLLWALVPWGSPGCWWLGFTHLRFRVLEGSSLCHQHFLWSFAFAIWLTWLLLCKDLKTLKHYAAIASLLPKSCGRFPSIHRETPQWFTAPQPGPFPVKFFIAKSPNGFILW